MKTFLNVVSALVIVGGIAACATTTTFNLLSGEKMNVIIASDTVSPGTTSMLYVDAEDANYYPYPTYAHIAVFDRAEVDWGQYTKFSYRYERRPPSPHVVRIIPSGKHTLTMHPGGQIITYDFKPEAFYVIKCTRRYTSNDHWDPIYTIDEAPAHDQTYSDMKTLAVEVIASKTYATASPLGQIVKNQGGGLPGALNRTAQTLAAALNNQDIIAVVDVSSDEKDMAQFVIEELEIILVQNKFIVVDRSTLDKIRQEQLFQLSGDVDDNSAISIGKFSGATVVIVGGIAGNGPMRRLRLRALHTETAQVIAAASEAF
jgi:hypothetical protein